MLAKDDLRRYMDLPTGLMGSSPAFPSLLSTSGLQPKGPANSEGGLPLQLILLGNTPRDLLREVSLCRSQSHSNWHRRLPIPRCTPESTVPSVVPTIDQPILFYPLAISIWATPGNLEFKLVTSLSYHPRHLKLGCRLVTVKRRWLVGNALDYYKWREGCKMDNKACKLLKSRPDEGIIKAQLRAQTSKTALPTPSCPPRESRCSHQHAP